MKRLQFLLALALLSLQCAAQTPQLAVDIPPAAHSSVPHFLTVYNNKLYMAASNGGGQYQFWGYDGINPPSVHCNCNLNQYDSKFGILNNKLYFIGGNDLYMYDGTGIASLAVEDTSSGFIGGQYMSVIGDKLYFQAHNSAIGAELCIYDGINTPDYYNIDGSAAGSYPGRFTEYNGKIYFCATTTATGSELYVYDPVADTTALVEEIEVGSASSGIYGLLAFGSKLYFIAGTAGHGLELYAYDGTSINRLTDVAPGMLDGVVFYTSYPELIAYNNRIYFAGYDGNSQQLYMYDTVSNTVSSAYTAPSTMPIEHFYVFDNKLYFTGKQPTTGFELWAFDGSNAWIVSDLRPGAAGSFISNFEIFNGKLYFNGDAGDNHGKELYFISPGGTNVSSASLNGNVMLIPNPTATDAMLQLSLNEVTSLQLSVNDISGRTVHSISPRKYSKGNSQITIPLSKQASGIYFYQLMNDKGLIMANGKIEKI